MKNLPAKPLIALALTACALLAGCGKQLSRQTSGPSALPAAGEHGARSQSTKNTTRLGGADGTSDAAAIAEAVYPGLTQATRPRAVALVDVYDWSTALAASTLAGWPLHAPLLYTHSGMLEASSRALLAMKPSGAAALGGAQVIRVRNAVTPPGYSTRAVGSANNSATGAVEIEQLASSLRGRKPDRVIVTGADAEPAMTMPAAGLAAQSATPILFVESSGIPPVTATELERLGRPSIFIVGPAAVVSKRIARELERYGKVTRIAGKNPVSNAIAVARFTDGAFGWGVVEPGHGLVFASAQRWLDGPPAALLSATGDYAPLLLLESPHKLPSELSGYLSDLQPGSPPSGPVHGVYNHGWLIGDESAISATVQARLDSILEIASRPASEPAVTPPASPSSEPTQTTGP